VGFQQVFIPVKCFFFRCSLSEWNFLLVRVQPIPPQNPLCFFRSSSRYFSLSFLYDRAWLISSGFLISWFSVFCSSRRKSTFSSFVPPPFPLSPYRGQLKLFAPKSISYSYSYSYSYFYFYFVCVCVVDLSRTGSIISYTCDLLRKKDFRHLFSPTLRRISFERLLPYIPLLAIITIPIIFFFSNFMAVWFRFVWLIVLAF
jgi:hypothetical protein